MIIPNTNIIASYEDLEAHIRAMERSLENMSLRTQMFACELQKVDKDNTIFDFKEGVVDKPMLYQIRKLIKDGLHDRFRDGARIKVRSQNLKP